MKGQKGFVMILVLWTLAFLTMIAGFYAVQSRVRRNLGQEVWDSLDAQYLTRSLLLLVSTRLAPPGMKPDEAWDKGLLIPDGTIYMVNIGGKDVTFSLEDEHGKLDLNNATEEQLKEALGGLLGKGTTADEIVDGILDWRDPDNIPRENGAEDEVYLAKTPPYLPANGPFHTLEELLLVNGVTQELFYGPIPYEFKDSGMDLEWKGGLRDIFTVYNKTGTVIKEYAPPPLRHIAGAGNAPFSHEVVCLKTKIGGMSYWIYWQPVQGGTNFKLVHWTETASAGSDQEDVLYGETPGKDGFSH
ncbi:type II secretion system minor pseudopilin [Dissulfurimicrobium hydrothermale]|uniref:general secretion pathway protein GspK n=1 Tax=Dissulfurimicrobium hydrothermale TaxID=1750598 RepID=UPI001EDB5318|nr:type II secretion system protein GspK [Dissulfurimicrobium hydrothermale]UKL13997.1 general secretion pathway protein GspK [Dissulfurimicrobium hydrothermale]